MKNAICVWHLLHPDFGCFEPEHPEEPQGVREHRAATLYAVIDVRGPILVCVDVDGRRHSTGDILLVKDRHLVLLRVSAESIGCGHARCPCANDANTLGGGGRHDGRW